MVRSEFLLKGKGYNETPVEVEGFSDGSVVVREGYDGNKVTVEIPADLVGRMLWQREWMRHMP